MLDRRRGTHDHGIITTKELTRRGMTKRDIGRAVADGRIERIRPGWYAFPGTAVEIVEAVRLGGAAGCISGAAIHGLWIPGGEPLHVSFDHADHRRVVEETVVPSDPRQVEVIAHWRAGVKLQTSKGLLPIVACLAEVLRCQPPDVAFAVIESALRQRRLTPDQRRWIEQHVARHRRATIASAESLADSGSESLFRYRMMLLDVMMRSQVEIPGVGRVDFVIGDRLVVEIDSATHHGGLEQRLRDLRRDAILVGLGFLPLRFDYQQVLYHWDTVEATVLAVVARGEHLHRRG